MTHARFDGTLKTVQKVPLESFMQVGTLRRYVIALDLNVIVLQTFGFFKIFEYYSFKFISSELGIYI